MGLCPGGGRRQTARKTGWNKLNAKGWQKQKQNKTKLYAVRHQREK